MHRFLICVAAGAGLAVSLGLEPLLVLRYAGAVTTFELAREIAACPACAFKLSA
ncbi:MAG: hypothetical protein V2J89_16085 [Halieaceae bacterium]|jgi:hypothetical protein|nr:hypothetical protein [Halieaceae bacterium]